jgi:H+-translocating NAD(P) transhydrogenase subunit alpha
VNPEVLLAAYVFLLAIFVGFEVIARVPSILHTPLMSGTNAIHGVVLLGAMLVAGAADTPLMHAVGFIAVVLGAANVFGGFVVTDRMLEMFKKKAVAEEKSDA